MVADVRGTRPRRARAAMILVSLLCLTSLVLSASRSRAAGDMSIGPVDVPVSIRYVPLVVPVVVRLSVTTEGDALNVAANATASLTEVEKSAKTIARALLVRGRKCRHAGVAPVVDRIDDARLEGSGDDALLAVSGHATALACTKIFGRMVKAGVAASDIKIDLPLRLKVGPANALGLVLAGMPQIVFGGSKASALVDAFSHDIDKLARRALDHALDTSKARIAMPAVPGFEGRIESASFVSHGTDLDVAIAAQAHLSAGGLTRLLARSLAKRRSQ